MQEIYKFPEKKYNRNINMSGVDFPGKEKEGEEDMTVQRQNDSLPSLGVTYENGRIYAAFTAQNNDCGLALYAKEDGRLLKRVSFLKKGKQGKVHYGSFPWKEADQVTYRLYDGEREYADPFARCFAGREYGSVCTEEQLSCEILNGTFDWEGEESPRLSYEESICYVMHVRGFTKHSSSNVAHPGTFLGIREKLSYLKELGITTLELQPAYEFIEKTGEDARLNYWGYQKGYYFAPKAAYAATEQPVNEFKELIKALHHLGMELIMQFYFPEEVSRLWIPEILQYWVSEYHIDGFHLMGANLPVSMLLEDPYLAGTKIWADDIPRMHGNWQAGSALEREANATGCLFAHYDGQYRNDMRRFLRGEQDLLQTVCRQMRRKPDGYGVIHYLTNYDGLTMMDLVSYEDRHNEANGEYNEDGCRDNLSWNCGVEGPTQKVQVLKMRMQQYQNAMSLLLLSQGTPLLFMGDEFGNTQFGNNNPYCQDNEITWLNWEKKEPQKECYEFTRQLIGFRKRHPILRLSREPRVMDYLALGNPDLSYHSDAAWKVPYRSLDRQIGMMYCGKYAEVTQTESDDDLYLAFNMHWESKVLALPHPSDEAWSWELVYTTDQLINEEEQKMWNNQNGQKISHGVIYMAPRTISVFRAGKVKEHESGVETF